MHIESLTLAEVGGNDSSKLRNLINLATRDALAMTFALKRGDVERARLLAVRARLGLDVLMGRSDGPSVGAVEQLQRLIAAGREVLQPSESTTTTSKLSPAVAMVSASLDGSNLDLADLELRGIEVGSVDLHGAGVRNCRVIAAVLVSSCLDDCLMAECDLERSNLERTSWRRATVVRSNLAGAVLSDACLDRALFIDCNLRGADLSVRKRGHLATTNHARFLRCDLRETQWDGRVLSGVRIADCKMHGVHGKPIIDRTAVHGADVSPHGDGSQPATLSDLRGWR